MDKKTKEKIRLIKQKYKGKNIYMCFISEGNIYLYPHDEILNKIEHRISDKTWLSKGTWSTPKLTKENKQLLKQYLL